MGKKLPVIDESFLDRVGVATPCNAAWSDMKGDARVRRCGECRLDVYNLSAMTRAEAAAFITRRSRTRSWGARTCVRLYRRGDGTLLTQDCWERLRAARRRGVWAFAAAVLVVGISQLALRVAGVNMLFGGLLSSGDGGQQVSMGKRVPLEDGERLGELAAPLVAPQGLPTVAAPEPVSAPTAPSTNPDLQPAKHHGRKPRSKPALPPEFAGQMMMGVMMLDK